MSGVWARAALVSALVALARAGPLVMAATPTRPDDLAQPSAMPTAVPSMTRVVDGRAVQRVERGQHLHVGIADEREHRPDLLVGQRPGDDLVDLHCFLSKRWVRCGIYGGTRPAACPTQ